MSAPDENMDATQSPGHPPARAGAASPPQGDLSPVARGLAGRLAPRFADPRRTARALALWRIASAFSLLGMVVLVYLVWTRGTQLSPLIQAALLVGIGCWLGTLVLVGRGQLGRAAWLLVIGQWAQPTLVCFGYGGVPPAISTSFLLAALLAGMLFDFPESARVLGLIVVTVVGFLSLGAVGVMEAPPNPAMAGSTLLVNLLSSVVVLASASAYRQFDRQLALRYEAELRHAQKMEAVGRLAGGIAHDFNNSLTVILGYAEILEDRTRGDARAHSAAEQVFAAARTAAELTSRLLSFSRCAEESTEITLLQQRIGGIEPMLSRLLGPEIRIEIDIEEDLPPVRVSGAAVEQIVVNLALNASDAMSGRGRLRIEASREATGGEPGDVLLRVCDEGVGMTEATIARAFDPFFTTKQERGGTGLGLSSVYGLVRSCGGTVRIASAPERGASVEIRFRASRQRPASAGPEASRETPKLSRKCALVAEDDPRVRALIVSVLEAAGHEVIESPDGAEAQALATAAKGPIDLLVSDVIMPRIDGVTLAERLASEHPQMRVLLVSGYRGALTRPLPTGAIFLAKPFSPRQLEKKLAEMFASA